MPVLRTLALPSMPSAVSGTTAHLFGALAGLADRGGGRALAAAGRLAGTLVSPLATPLAPDDYLGLIDPLLSARHPAGRVVAVRPECAGAATLEIRPGRGWAGHRAGQYLPVGVEIDGVRHWRTYSITSPAEAPGRTLTITVKEEPGGRVSPHLVHRTRPGTVLRLGPAQGEFTLPEDPLPPRMLMVTAGSGITPVPADAWKHTHNHLHHTYTNVVGLDRDLGYTILRMSPDQPWHPVHLFQPLYTALLAPVFEWGIALYDLEADALPSGRKSVRALLRDLAGLARKAVRQAAKDYVLFPLLAGPSALPCLVGNVTANGLRNIWAHTVIFCGHFPGDVQTFSYEEEQLEGETRGQWYLRQIQGSANIEGGHLLHILTGNLSHQIEHHVFPDLPSNRYAELAPRVREICARHGITYVSGPLWRQYASMWGRVLRHSVPDGSRKP